MTNAQTIKVNATVNRRLRNNILRVQSNGTMTQAQREVKSRALTYRLDGLDSEGSLYLISSKNRLHVTSNGQISSVDMPR